MSYFTLITRQPGELSFAPQFGDYDRDVVAQERRDSYADVKAGDWKIVASKTSRQRDVDAAIAKINAKEIDRALEAAADQIAATLPKIG